MSQSDSFIDEVTDALRRDRLFATLRRWAWLGVLLVVLIVGGAAVREWRLARAEAEAQARGDALLAAVEAGDPEAVAAVPAEGATAAVVALLAAATAADGGVPDAVAERLEAVAADAALPARLRDLAALKAALAATGASPEERRARLEAIAAPGAPYRLLAEEQLALLDAEAGEREAAQARLRAILDDAEATPALQERARQLLVALGGALDAA